MKANTKLRLASRRQLDKADVESVYGEMVRVVGGAYYSGGATVGPANGLLDWRNFSGAAGIPNTNKANPYSILCLTPDTEAIGTFNSFVSGGPATTTATFPVPFPWALDGVFPDALQKGYYGLYVVGLTLGADSYTPCSGSPAGISISLVAWLPNGTSTTVALPPASIIGAGTNQLLISQVVSAIALNPRAAMTVYLSWANATGGSIVNPVVGVWLKVVHLKV